MKSMTGFFQEVRIPHEDHFGSPRHHGAYPVFESSSRGDVDGIGNVTLCIGRGVPNVHQVVLGRFSQVSGGLDLGGHRGVPIYWWRSLAVHLCIVLKVLRRFREALENERANSPLPFAFKYGLVAFS